MTRLNSGIGQTCLPTLKDLWAEDVRDPIRDAVPSEMTSPYKTKKEIKRFLGFGPLLRQTV